MRKIGSSFLIVALAPWIAAILLFTADLARAQTTVNQGEGKKTGVEWQVSNSAKRSGATTETCVTNAAGGSYVPGGASSGALADRKAIELQNLGPNSIFCTVDGQAPLATGALGREIAADGVWAIDAGPNIAIRCIAATAAQVTTNCTMVTEVR